MSSKLVVVGDSYCMNYIKMRNKAHLESNEPYILYHPALNAPTEFKWNYTNEYPIWPEIVAKKYNMNLINLSESGAGNYSIFSMALDAIVKEKPDKLIVAWSGWDRFEFEAEEVKMKKRIISKTSPIEKDEIFYLTPKNNTRTAWIRYHPQPWGNLNNTKYGTNSLQDIESVGGFKIIAGINMFMRLAYSLQELCKSLNIDLKMFQSVRPFTTVEKNEEAAKLIIKDLFLDKIDDKIFKGFPTLNYIGGSCFSDIIYTNDRIHNISKYDGHPNEEGHKKIASYVAS